MNDPHDELLDDLAQAGPEYGPDLELIATICAAGFTVIQPGDDLGDGYHYLVTREAPPLRFAIPPMGLRAWWWGWVTALFATHNGAAAEIRTLTTERDALRRMVGDDRRMMREAKRRGLTW